MLINTLIVKYSKNKFKKYSKISLKYKICGHDIAQKMLNDNGIYDVKITSNSKDFKDNYNNITKTIELSPEVYYGSSITSAAIVTHECGHAIQYNKAFINCAQNLAYSMLYWFLFIGVLIIEFFSQLFWLGIFLFWVTSLNSLANLTVEFNASKIALKWVDNAGFVTSMEFEKIRNSLMWAGGTYLTTFVISIITLFYYLFIF